MNSNSDSRLSRNSAVETLMRKNTENGTKLTETPYLPQVYAIPAEQRELEHKVLMDAVNFQPELYRQISRLPTREELKEHVADIQDIEADYMERTVNTLTEENAKTVSKMKTLTEQAARDTSKKIRAVIKSKADKGERVGTTVPYGYRRDPDSGKNVHLLINDETAPVVRMIFAMCAEGKGPKVIANYLKEQKILKPSMYNFETNGKYGAITDTADPYGWNDRTVAGILDNEIYLGHTINLQTTISDEQFRMLSSDYEDEQKTLNEKIPVLETEIERLKSECTNVQRFLDITEKYTDITELTPELLRTFVNKIVIYEREKKHDKNAPQQIDIYYRYIGSMCGTGEETEENDETESDS